MLILLCNTGIAQVQIDKPVQLTGVGTNAQVSGIKTADDSLDAVSAGMVQSGGLLYATASGTSSAIIVSINPAPQAYTPGMIVNFKATLSVTGTTTINVNGLGAKAIKKNVVNDLAANDFLANQMVSIIYDGTNFQLLSPSPPASTAVSSKRAFVSSAATYTGNLGGISGADNICQGLANTAGIGGTWRAFLSTSTVNAVNRSTYAGRIVNMKGQTLSDNGWAGLRFNIPASIFWDQNGNPLPTMTNEFAHTGTAADGTASSGENCNNWTSNSAAVNTVIGLPYSSTTDWIAYTPTNCSNPRRLYCIED